MSFPDKNKWLYLIVGPNGAGKSTLYHKTIKPIVNLPLVNADEIQKTEVRDISDKGSLRAALIAGRRRIEYLKSGQSFVTETVFAKSTKNSIVERAKSAGFRVIVYHVSVKTQNLAVSRVRLRVSKGGHNVPESKIRERFAQNEDAIKQAVLEADYAYVYDNSEFESMPKLQLMMSRGQVTRLGLHLEKWCSELYSDEIQKARL